MFFRSLSPAHSLTSHAFQSGCGCSRNHWMWSRTRCTCCRQGRGGACAWASGCSPNRSSTNRTIHSASRRRDARACAWASGCNPSRSSSIRSICISYSSVFLQESHGDSIAKKTMGAVRFLPIFQSTNISTCRLHGRVPDGRKMTAEIILIHHYLNNV